MFPVGVAVTEVHVSIPLENAPLPSPPHQPGHTTALATSRTALCEWRNGRATQSKSIIPRVTLERWTGVIVFYVALEVHGDDRLVGRLERVSSACSCPSERHQDH